MNKPILFVGQCKQGSNSLFDLLRNQEGLCSGNNIRAMVRSDMEQTDYFSNWDNIDTTDSHYLLDKSIINPERYDYRVGHWQDYNHRMIYMFRNIKDVLRSQFLVVLAGEASYQHCIPKGGKDWHIDLDSPLEDVLEVLEYNEQKFTHLQNIQGLPAEVFDPQKNMFFCTFEDFKADTPAMLKQVETFLGVPLEAREYPHLNSTVCDWYRGNLATLDMYKRVFLKHQEAIFEKYIKAEDYQQLHEITGIDLLTKWGIRV